MKKILCLVVSFVLISCVMPVNAEQSKPTNRVSVMEFCELYAKRIASFNSRYGENMGGLDDSIFYTSNPVMENSGDILVTSCSGGTVMLDKSDLGIDALLVEIMDVDAEGQEGHNVVLNAIIVISVLEMRDMQEDILERWHNEVDSEMPESAFEMYLEEYSNVIHPTISSHVDALQRGDSVFVYRGNYDYTVSYVDDSDLGKVINLYAHARK